MNRVALALIVLLALAACAPEEVKHVPESTATYTPTPTPTAPATPQPPDTATPTPTPVLIAGASATPTAPPLATSGWLEIRIIDPMDGEPECLAEIPFTVTRAEDDRYLVDGGGPIDCEFVNPQPQLGTHHHIYDLETTLQGEVRTDIPEQPQGALHADLFLTGKLTQIYTDIPPKITQLCTEASPCSFPPNAEPLMIVMDYVEGATVYLTKSGMVSELGGEVAAWTILLHLGP